MQGHAMSQEQAARALPEQILASSVLKMNASELAQFVCEQMAENPALSVEEVEQCPICGTPIYDTDCPLCGASPTQSVEEPEFRDDEWFDHPIAESLDIFDSGSDFDPFTLIASPMDIRDYLKSQVRVILNKPQDLKVAVSIIDSLDEDGYFREDLYEIASTLKLAVPEVEKVLKIVQSLEPPGIAARNIKECLLLQLYRLLDDPMARLTAELVETCWEDLAKLKMTQIAERLQVEVDDIKRCIGYMREKLNPNPGSLYRAPWSEFAPTLHGQIVPDVVIRMRGDNPVVEVLDFQAGLLKLDEEYESIAADSTGLSPEERKHIRDYVDKARCILDAVQLRRKTLAKITLSLAEYQKDYLVMGPCGLKPLKQKELAALIGIHESTVCRALNGKFVRLPSGEVVPFDTFFDSSLPVKEMIRAIIAGGEPLSDGEITKRLCDQGIQIARRTVAKYRDQLRVPSINFR